MSKKPYKFTAPKREEYLSLISEDGLGRHRAAKQVGVSPPTVVSYAKDNPEFAEARDQAEMEANEQVENALFNAAKSGHVTACQVWLYNRMPDRWSDKRQTSNIDTSAVVAWLDTMKAQ